VVAALVVCADPRLLDHPMMIALWLVRHITDA
jgi:hypothetical protein